MSLALSESKKLLNVESMLDSEQVRELIPILSEIRDMDTSSFDNKIIESKQIVAEFTKTPYLFDHYDAIIEVMKPGGLFRLYNFMNSSANSQVFDLSHEGRVDIPGKMICFTNGMKNNLEDATSHIRYLSDKAGGCNVHCCFNGTAGGIFDMIECALGYAGIATGPVKDILATWSEFAYNNKDNNNTLLQIEQSQAGIHVKNAVLLSPKEVREKVCILGIAPADYIQDEWVCDTQHLVSESDIVPWIKPFMDSIVSMKDKGVANVIAGNLAGLQPQLPDNVTVLPRHPDSKWWNDPFDHGTQSPTYDQPVDDVLNFYLRYGKIK